MVAILVGLVGAAASRRDAPGWVHGVDTIGMGETGVATIGMAAIGAVVTGMAAIGTTGTAIGITVTIAWSSLAISAFQDGGAGAGDTPMAATDIRTDITGTAITRTITMVMDTAGIRMATMDTADTGTTTAPVMDIADMGTTTAPVTDTSMAADQGIPGVSGGGDKPRLRVFEIARLLMHIDQVGPPDASIRRQDRPED